MTRNADDMGMPPVNAIAALKSAAATPLDHERLEYVKEIMAAIKLGQSGDYFDSPEFAINRLLMEWGARAYRQGLQHMAERMKACADEWADSGSLHSGFKPVL